LRSEGLVPSSQSFDPSEVRRLFSDGKLMMLSGLTVVVYSKIDILAAGSLLTKEAVGAYAMAATMAAAWNMVGMSLGQAWAPHVSASRAAGNESYVRTLRRLLITALLLSVAGSIFLSSISGFIFDLLLGGRFAGSVHLFSILVWSSVPVFLGIATSQIIVNNNIYWVSLLRTATGMIISLALVVPVTSAWGAEGVAFLVVLSACITVIGILFSRSARVTLSRVLGFA
jgi:PST family polysaccharide transporter